MARARCHPAPVLTKWLPRHGRLSVIDPLHEPLVAAEVVEQLAQQRAVEKRLPVFAYERLLPPLGFDLPACDRVDRARPCSRDEGRRAVGIQCDSPGGVGAEEAGHGTTA